MAKSRAFASIQRALQGQHPLAYLVSWEEQRIETILKLVARTSFRTELPFFSWTRTGGLVGPEGVVAETRDPCALVTHLINDAPQGLFLLKDLPRAFAEGDHVLLVRLFRDFYRKMRDRGRFVFVVSPELLLPMDLKKEFLVVDMDLPSDAELAQVLEMLSQKYQQEETLTESLEREMVQGMKGLTIDEATHLLHKTLGGKKQIDGAVVDEILAEKEQISRKEGVLEFIPPRWSLADVGGLEVLKEWLNKRARLFGADARAAGIPAPKGVLLMGMSGCGKSLSVKAISSLWRLPLFRLDINRVFSGVGGSPEALFRRALETAEAVSPCVLWIDEIEMGVAGYRDGDGGVTSRIFSTFLTWMQEKEEQVFVAATANRIQLLPAEIIRKGRFDQVFFIDLPTEEERKAIFAVHFRRVGVDPATTDLVFLAKATKGWNGAEIEQCIAAGCIEAFDLGRSLEENDLYRIISSTVPLSITMEEQMKAIKNWAHDRAVAAGHPP